MNPSKGRGHVHLAASAILVISILSIACLFLTCHANAHGSGGMRIDRRVENDIEAEVELDDRNDTDVNVDDLKTETLKRTMIPLMGKSLSKSLSIDQDKSIIDNSVSTTPSANSSTTPSKSISQSISRSISRRTTTSVQMNFIRRTRCFPFSEPIPIPIPPDSTNHRPTNQRHRPHLSWGSCNAVFQDFLRTHRQNHWTMTHNRQIAFRNAEYLHVPYHQTHHQSRPDGNGYANDNGDCSIVINLLGDESNQPRLHRLLTRDVLQLAVQTVLMTCFDHPVKQESSPFNGIRNGMRNGNEEGIYPNLRVDGGRIRLTTPSVEIFVIPALPPSRPDPIINANHANTVNNANS